MYPKPKKSLGQHFLIDKNIQRKIVDSCKLQKSDIVLEIGAGRGELTELIAPKVNKIYALEVDPYLCDILKNGFKEYKNVKIIHKDILKFNLNRHFNKLTKIKIIGNIPYYITSPIIEHLIKFREKINTIFITVQKEFAKRIVAHPGSGDYGSFSCFLQYYTQAQIIFLIKRTCFKPQPKVDSSFLRLDIRTHPKFFLKNERLFLKIIRAAFSQRRKTLRNSLKGLISAKKLAAFFKKYSLSPDIRPEELWLEDFANLTNI